MNTYSSPIFRLVFVLFFSGISTTCLSQFWDFTEPERLSSFVNSEAEESMPIFSKDSSILFFVRTFDASNTGSEFDQDIWFSRKDANGFFSKSERLSVMNSKLNNSVCGISADGNTIYLVDSYDTKSRKVKGISSSSFKNNKWSTPKPISIPNLNLSGNFISFFMSKTEDVLFVSYIGNASLGEEDLYVLVKENGSWSEPKHLGNVINSTRFEISPYIVDTHDTLFFSSNGHGGFGDADIFYSIRLDDSFTNWSTPVNMGEKINSPGFDAYLIHAGNAFYWSSNRSSEKSDLYFSKHIPPPPIELAADVKQAFDPKNGHEITLNVNGGAKQLRFEWSNGDTIQHPKNVKAGIYTVVVSDEWGQKATLQVEVKDPPVVVPMIASVADANKSDAKKLKSSNAKTPEFDESLNKDLNNHIIYFDNNSSYFNGDNRKVLTKIVPILQQQPELKIFVQSYCDKNGTDNYNFWLSEKRMNRVIEYLVANGIDRSRITGDYKGETEPMVNCKNCSELQLKLNRRTTIKFVK